MRKRVKQYYHPYGGRRIPWWGKVIIALILLAAVCFGILEGPLVPCSGRCCTAPMTTFRANPR